MDNRQRLELYRELIGLADSLDEHVSSDEAAAKLRELANEIDPRDMVIRQMIDEATLNRVAQYFYEATHDSNQLNLVMNMTGKPALVEALRQAMERAELIPRRVEDWTIAYLHADCPRCEACAELAIDSAKATGERSGSWQEIVPVPGHPTQGTIGHRAVVERRR